MDKEIEKFCRTCQLCQLAKQEQKKYVKLPAKVAEETMWKLVNVDLWGPRTLKYKQVQGTRCKKATLSLHVLTIIDPATGWFECAALRNAPTADKIHRLFDNMWLTRYPQPKEIGFNNGSEFKAEFRALIDNMGLKRKTSTSFNPLSNVTLEHVHQVFANNL